MAQGDRKAKAAVKARGERKAKDAVLELELESRASVLEQLAKAGAEGNESRYQLGQLYYQLTRDLDFPYTLIEDYVQRVYGVQLPTKGTMSRLRRVHLVWVVELGYPIERLRRTSPHTLYLVQLTLGQELSPNTAAEWLQRAETLPRDELMLALDKQAGRFGFRRATIGVDENVKASFQAALDEFTKAVGRDELSTTAFVEFLAQLILDSRPDVLRGLWRRMHGEEDDDT